MLKEVSSAGNVVLFIDEVHAHGRPSGQGGRKACSDAANLLKPAASARGELRCIKRDDVPRRIPQVRRKRHAALSCRFQPVYVNEPSVEDNDRHSSAGWKAAL